VEIYSFNRYEETASSFLQEKSSFDLTVFHQSALAEILASSSYSAIADDYFL